MFISPRFTGLVYDELSALLRTPCGSPGSYLYEQTVIRRLARTDLSLPDSDRARAERLGERGYSSIGLEQGVDKRPNAGGGCKNQE